MLLENINIKNKQMVGKKVNISPWRLTNGHIAGLEKSNICLCRILFQMVPNTLKNIDIFFRVCSLSTAVEIRSYFESEYSHRSQCGTELTI